MEPPTDNLGLSIRLREGTDGSTKSCNLNWDREKVRETEDMFSIDLGEWTTFDQLESEVKRGCEKCAIIHAGIQHYRSTFEGRAKGARIYRNSGGIACIIQRELREGERSVRHVALQFFRDKGKAAPCISLAASGRSSQTATSDFLSSDDGCPWLPVLHRPMVAPNTDCPESFEQLREWIKTCDADHELCSGPSNATLPTRILDLGEDSHEHGDLSLRDGRNESGLYATLSHCWGSYQPLRTT